MSDVVLFRVDAGPGIGIGHLHRCLALASAFAERGCAVAFVVNDRPEVTDRVAAAGWPVARLEGVVSWTDADADHVVSEIARTHATLVVVDSDLESGAYTRRVKASGVTVCAVEDNSDEDVEAHVLLNGDAHALRQTYRAAVADTRYLLGPAYAPLSQEYWNGPARAAAVPPQHVLLTLGGSDPHGLLPLLITAAAALPVTFQLHVVIGPFSGRREEIAAALHALEGRVTSHVAPASMRPLIDRCDLALSGAGQTLYELAAFGRPVVAIELADNQHLQLDEFVRSGAVIRAGLAGDADIAGLAVAMVADLAIRPEHLRMMSEAGPKFIDAQGARRAAAALLDAL